MSSLLLMNQKSDSRKNKPVLKGTDHPEMKILPTCMTFSLLWNCRDFHCVDLHDVCLRKRFDVCFKRGTSTMMHDEK